MKPLTNLLTVKEQTDYLPIDSLENLSVTVSNGTLAKRLFRTTYKSYTSACSKSKYSLLHFSHLSLMIWNVSTPSNKLLFSITLCNFTSQYGHIPLSTLNAFSSISSFSTFIKSLFTLRLIKFYLPVRRGISSYYICSFSFVSKNYCNVTIIETNSKVSFQFSSKNKWFTQESIFDFISSYVMPFQNLLFNSVLNNHIFYYHLNHSLIFLIKKDSKVLMNYQANDQSLFVTTSRKTLSAIPLKVTADEDEKITKLTFNQSFSSNTNLTLAFGYLGTVNTRSDTG